MAGNPFDEVYGAAPEFPQPTALAKVQPTAVGTNPFDQVYGANASPDEQAAVQARLREKYPQMFQSGWVPGYKHPLQETARRTVLGGIAPVLAGVTGGTAAITTRLPDILDFVLEMAGVPEENRTTPLKLLNAELQANSAFWERTVQERGTPKIVELLGKVAGGAAPGILNWMGGPGLAAVEGAVQAAKEGKSFVGVAESAARGAAKRVVFGAALGKIGGIVKPILRRGLGAATLGGMAVMEGATPAEVLTQAVVGGLMTGGTGRLRRTAETVEPTPVETPAEVVPSTRPVLGAEKFYTQPRPVARTLVRPQPIEFARPGAEPSAAGEPVEAVPAQRLALSVMERLDNAASARYDRLVSQAEAGHKGALAELRRIHSGDDLPTYASLAKRAKSGDRVAARLIADGEYQGGANALPAALRKDTLRTFKLPEEAPAPKLPITLTPRGEAPPTSELPLRLSRVPEEKPSRTNILLKMSRAEAAQGAKKKSGKAVPVAEPAPTAASVVEQPSSFARRLATEAQQPPIEAPGAIREGQTPPPPTQSTPRKGINPPTPESLQFAEAQKVLNDWVPGVRAFNKKIVAQAKRVRTAQQAKNYNALYAKLEPEVGAFEARKQATVAMGGGAEVPAYEVPKLSPEHYKALQDRAEQVYAGDAFNTKHFNEALEKMQGGHWLTEGDLHSLGPVLGEETTVALAKGMAKAEGRGFAGYVKLILQGGKVPIMSDLQTAYQLAPIAGRHPVMYGKAVVSTIRAAYRRAYAQETWARVQADPTFPEMTKFTTILTDRFDIPGRKIMRAEQYSSDVGTVLAEAGAKSSTLKRLATTGLRVYGKVIQNSEQAYNTGMLIGKHTLWKLEHAKWVKEGLYDTEGLPKDALVVKKAALEARQEAFGKHLDHFFKTINSKNPSAKSIMRALGVVLTSPSATLAPFAQAADVIANKGYRLETGLTLGLGLAKDFAVVATAAAAAQEYERRTGKKSPLQAQINPFKPGYGFQIGNTHLDVSGGMNTFRTFLLRLGTAAYAYEKRAVEGEIRGEVAGGPVMHPWETITRWASGRGTPIIGDIRGMITGRDFSGKHLARWKLALQAVAPNQLKDFYEAANDAGLWANLEKFRKGGAVKPGQTTKSLAIGAAAGAASYLSIGVNTYADSPHAALKKFRDAIAHEAHGARWDDLTPPQQNKLAYQKRTELASLDQAAKMSRYENPVLSRKYQEEQKQAGGLVKASLSPANRTKLTGTPLALSRIVGGFHLNDERFNAYIILVSRHLEEGLSRASTALSNPEAETARTGAILKAAKARAWGQIYSQMVRKSTLAKAQ